MIKVTLKGYARRVQRLMPSKQSLDALDVAERYADGTATFEEWDAARDAACAAARNTTWNAANITAWEAT
jgi:hypothetical protein